VKRDRVITGVAAGLTALVLAACGAQSAAPSPTTGAPTTVAPTVAVPTLVPLPTSQPIQLGVTGIGEVKSVRDANLSFQVQGTVAQVFVKEGDVVKKAICSPFSTPARSISNWSRRKRRLPMRWRRKLR
jgi:HlyD family secretion protein